MIVVAGEALIDLVPQQTAAAAAAAAGDRDRTDRTAPAALLPRLGGGPFNTAVALGRLGSPAAFCSRISTDVFGDMLMEGLKASGVDTSLVQRGHEPTTLAVAALGPDGSAGFGFYAEGSADRLFELPHTLPPEVRALALGTCSLVLEPGASAYEALLRRESARGVFTLLDPNIRPGLIPDPDAYRTRFTGWLPSVTLLKLSVDDAAWLGGVPAEWTARGPAAVVLTRGAEGLSVWTADGTEVSVPAAPVSVVDTIGAGDTVNAAVLHALSVRDALSPSGLVALGASGWREVLDFASHAAAEVCARAGA
ncbi:carbohydrate kinase [Streptomyces sp. NPDC087420]|uniref:carbohydrate kinase family protein n=1 Tax=Streptomyces sp. NPDC087420 TaxID=3365785 RepID=UPI00383260F5